MPFQARPLRRRATSIRVLVALLYLAIPVYAGGADEVEKLSQRRLSPGVVALFARHTTDPRIAERLKIALSDAAAPVRAVAARVVAVGAIGGLLSSVREALARETDVDAAAEEIRALCSIGGPAADPEALTALKRFSPRLDGTYVRLVGRLRGASAMDSYFATLRELALSPSDRRAFFRHIANRDGPEVLNAVGSLALSQRAVKDWEAVLAVAAERETQLKEGLLIAALRGEEAVFRGEAAWFLAKTYRKGPPQNAGEILEAVSDERVSSSDAELRFGCEILRRVLGKPAVEDEKWIGSLGTNLHCHLDSDFFESSLVELLTERERNALFWRNLGGRHQTPAVVPEARGGELRLVSGFPKGITEDLLAAGDCRPNLRTPRFSVADIEFAPHGLPRRVSLAAASPDRYCQRTAEAIFLMAAAPDDGDLRVRHGIYLALFEADCLICNENSVPPVAAGTTGATAETLRVRAGVVAPKLEKKVEPSYPENARRQYQEGISIYEAIISPTGCVRDIRLLKSSYPILDLMGMEAVARWRYKPATLEGRPVSVYLTVTVTYSLRK